MSGRGKHTADGALFARQVGIHSAEDDQGGFLMIRSIIDPSLSFLRDIKLNKSQTIEYLELFKPLLPLKFTNDFAIISINLMGLYNCASGCKCGDDCKCCT